MEASISIIALVAILMLLFKDMNGKSELNGIRTELAKMNKLFEKYLNILEKRSKE